LPKALKFKNIKVITEFENVFEKIGIPALLIQVITGLALMHRHLILPFSFEQRGDLLIVIKLGLLLLTILLALHARLKLIPKLNRKTLPLLGLHVVAVTLVGILFVIVGLSFRTNLFF
jgi:Kef-type K+ transport system membrane component KefB